METSQSTTEIAQSSVSRILWGSGVVMLLIYIAIGWLSFACEQSDPKATRPLLTMVALFTVAGIGYLVVCWQTIWKDAPVPGAGAMSRGLKIVFGFGVLFRLVLLFSVPIQEVDLFRYIWDGTVVSLGISPYEYSPQEVELFPTRGVPNYRTRLVEREDLARLSKIAASPEMVKAFSLVHFEQYTTPYPLINQAPFALASVIGRAIGTFWGVIWAMKGVLILFDLATAMLLVRLLKRLSLPPIWVVAYLWCPLLLKEIANSGHLDSIVVFLTTAAVYLMTTTYWQSADCTPSVSIYRSCRVGLVLALAVAAKLFPVVLVPIWAVLMYKRMKFAALVPLVLFSVLTFALLWPMVGRTALMRDSIKTVKANFWEGKSPESKSPDLNVRDEHADATMITAPPAGIEAFVKYWEMNDFIFMVTIENLKPYGSTAQQYAQQMAQRNESAESKVWFVGTSNEFRHTLSDWYAEATGVSKRSAAFSMTRRLTLLVFLGIVAWTCVRIWRYDHPLVMLEMVFLTIAWFWFLAPTQNPWYWTWALPWLVFCRNRIWFVVAVVVMAYYLRFYFEYHGVVGPKETGLLGTPYAGTAFFDFIFPVLEFGPVLLALACSWGWRQRKRLDAQNWPIVDCESPDRGQDK